MLATTTTVTRSTETLPTCTWTKGQGGWYVQFPGATTPTEGFVRVRRATGETETHYVVVTTTEVRGAQRQVGLPVKGIVQCPQCNGKAARLPAPRTGNYLRNVTRPYFQCTNPACLCTFGG